MRLYAAILPLFLAPVLLWTGPLSADYTLLLKNGRRLTVRAYREEDGKVIAQGLGGTFSLAKEQIESIQRAQAEVTGTAAPGPGEAPGPATDTGEGETRTVRPDLSEKGEERGPQPAKVEEKTQSPEERRAEERAKEEKKYQKRVRELTEQIKAAMSRYSQATGRKPGAEPSLLEGPEAIRGRTADLISRLRDGQYNPSGPGDAGGVVLSRPSPFTGGPSEAVELRRGVNRPRVTAPLPAYSAKEKELSRLRRQIVLLQKQRERLIQEMKEKEFDTGSLFLD